MGRLGLMRVALQIDDVAGVRLGEGNDRPVDALCSGMQVGHRAPFTCQSQFAPEPALRTPGGAGKGEGLPPGIPLLTVSAIRVYGSDMALLTPQHRTQDT